MSTIQKKVSIRNKKARFNYDILETWVAGIVLTGTEIKSLRQGNASLVDCYCAFHGGELYVHGMNISPYAMGTYTNHESRRDRKLLLNKRELRTIERSLQDKGTTVIGLKLFINDRGFAKLEIGLARGRKLHDKRDYIRDRDVKREIDRTMKRY